MFRALAYVSGTGMCLSSNILLPSQPSREAEVADLLGFHPGSTVDEYRSAIDVRRGYDQTSTLIYADKSTGFRLYLGSLRDAMDLKRLEYLNITGIINMAATDSDKVNGFEFSSDSYSEALHMKDFPYLSIGIEDSVDQLITPYFPETLDFIDLARKQGRHILVHCYRGRNRSAAVVVAWLVNRAKLPLNVALYRVASRRRLPRGGVLTNTGFLKELIEFARS
jgi:Dual specificity phosphatase, catalytic domain